MLWSYYGFDSHSHVQGVREIIIIVMDNYLIYKEPKSPYNFFLSLIFNELFTFKILDWKEIKPLFTQSYANLCFVYTFAAISDQKMSM